MQQVDGAVLAASEVFHQAHDQAVLGIGIDDEGGNLVLAKRLIGLQPTLAADESRIAGRPRHPDGSP